MKKMIIYIIIGVVVIVMITIALFSSQVSKEVPSLIFYPEEYEVSIDYRQNVESLIKDCDIKYTNRYINSKNFPIEDKGQKQIIVKILRFDSKNDVSTKNLLQAINNSGYRPLTITEILSLYSKYPNLLNDKDRAVVALGSAYLTFFGWNFPGVPYISNLLNEKTLDLYSRNDSSQLFSDHVSADWPPSEYKFAVTKK